MLAIRLLATGEAPDLSPYRSDMPGGGPVETIAESIGEHPPGVVIDAIDWPDGPADPERAGFPRGGIVIAAGERDALWPASLPAGPQRWRILDQRGDELRPTVDIAKARILARIAWPRRSALARAGLGADAVLAIAADLAAIRPRQALAALAAVRAAGDDAPILWGLAASAALAAHDAPLALAAAERALPGIAAEDRPAIQEIAGIAARCCGRWDRFAELVRDQPSLLGSNKKEQAALAAAAKAVAGRPAGGPADPWRLLERSEIADGEEAPAGSGAATAACAVTRLPDGAIGDSLWQDVGPAGSDVGLAATFTPSPAAVRPFPARHPLYAAGLRQGGLSTGRILVQVQVYDDGLVAIRMQDLPRWHLPGTWTPSPAGVSVRIALAGDRCTVHVGGALVADAPVAVPEGKRQLTGFISTTAPGVLRDASWRRLVRPDTGGAMAATAPAAAATAEPPPPRPAMLATTPTDWLF